MAVTFTSSGTKATTQVALPKEVFSMEVTSHQLLKQAYQQHQASARTAQATSKTRGLIRGGGRKPWKQKGTGRARVGSIRSPLWRGGGITFGPTGNQNYTKQLNKKARQSAIRQALSLKSDDKAVSVIEALDSKEGKTKELVSLLKKIEANRRVLILVSDKTPELARAAKNIQSLSLKQATYTNVYEILNADHIIITKDALSDIQKWLGVKA